MSVAFLWMPFLVSFLYVCLLASACFPFHLHTFFSYFSSLNCGLLLVGVSSVCCCWNNFRLLNWAAEECQHCAGSSSGTSNYELWLINFLEKGHTAASSQDERTFSWLAFNAQFKFNAWPFLHVGMCVCIFVCVSIALYVGTLFWVKWPFRRWTFRPFCWSVTNFWCIFYNLPMRTCCMCGICLFIYVCVGYVSHRLSPCVCVLGLQNKTQFSMSCSSK